MPEALARMRREPTLSAPAREPAPRRPRPAAAKIPWFLPRTVGPYLASLFAAALIGVVVNAVVLQHGRHPAALSGADPAPSPAAARLPDAPAPAPAAPAMRADPAPTPVARPSDAAAPSSKKADPISDLLRAGGGSDPARDVYAVQRALKRLGYDIEPDGRLGSDTERALKEFEKAHGLPSSGEITPRLIARLNAATR